MPTDDVEDYSYKNLDAINVLRLPWKKVEHLILDGNRLSDNVIYPKMPNLKTLSLNKNNIKDLHKLCRKLRRSCPNVHHLSIIGNPCSLHPALPSTNCEDPTAYANYRAQIIVYFPVLIFLDSSYVSKTEKLLAYTKLYEMNGQMSKNGSDTSCMYGKVFTKYQGKYSEGNRFIRDQHL